MKHFLTAAALLLATIASAQPQIDRLPVMCLSDWDVYLEPDHQPGKVLDSIPPAAAQYSSTNNALQVTDPQANTLTVATYLLYQQVWEEVYPGKFYEELGYLYGTETPLTPQEFEYLFSRAGIWQYAMEK
jgi:hypothetical protein